MFTFSDLDRIDARTWGDVGMIRAAIRDAKSEGYKPGRFRRKTPSLFDEG